VANPLAAREAATGEACLYARPDERVDPVRPHTWREVLVDYNRRRENPHNLFPAYRLYTHRAYGQLATALGQENLYILSAGWGLIRSGFLTPQYDITFSTSAERYRRRRKGDAYADFRHLGDDVQGPILFFGGKDYVPFFCELTARLTAQRIVFFNSSEAPEAPGCRLTRYRTRTRTNWHYECVDAFLAGRLSHKPR
jgi:hypothetical protein